jgi:hypothetical protein
VYEFGDFRVDAHKRLLMLSATGSPLAVRFGAPACHDLAIFYARRDDADHAMPLLEQCYRNHDFFLPLLKGDPLFRRLQPNPLFQGMIHRFDIPE